MDPFFGPGYFFVPKYKGHLESYFFPFNINGFAAVCILPVVCYKPACFCFAPLQLYTQKHYMVMLEKERLQVFDPTNWRSSYRVEVAAFVHHYLVPKREYHMHYETRPLKWEILVTKITKPFNSYNPTRWIGSYESNKKMSQTNGIEWNELNRAKIILWVLNALKGVTVEL